MKFIPIYLVSLLFLLLLTVFCLHFSLNSQCGSIFFLLITKKDNLSKCFILAPGKTGSSGFRDSMKEFSVLNGQESGVNLLAISDIDKVSKPNERIIYETPNLKKSRFVKMSGDFSQEKADGNVQQTLSEMKKLNNEFVFEEQYESKIKNDFVKPSVQYQIFSKKFKTYLNSIEDLPLSKMMMMVQPNSNNKILLESYGNRNDDKIPLSLPKIVISEELAKKYNTNSLVKTSIQSRGTEEVNNNSFSTKDNKNNQIEVLKSENDKNQNLITLTNKNIVVAIMHNYETPKINMNTINETVRYLNVAQDKHEKNKIVNNKFLIQPNAMNRSLIPNNIFFQGDNYNLINQIKQLNEAETKVDQSVAASTQPSFFFHFKNNETKVEAFGNNKTITETISKKLNESKFTENEPKNYENETFDKIRNLAATENFENLAGSNHDTHNNNHISVDLNDEKFSNVFPEAEKNNTENKKQNIIQSEEANFDEKTLVDTEDIFRNVELNNISENQKNYLAKKKIEQTGKNEFFHNNSSAIEKIAALDQNRKTLINEILLKSQQQSRFPMYSNLSLYSNIEEGELVGSTSGSIASQAIRYYYGIIHDLEVDRKFLKGKGVLPWKEQSFSPFLFGFTEVISSLSSLSTSIYHKPSSSKNGYNHNNPSYSYSIDVVPVCSSVLDGAVQSLTPGWIRSINSLGSIFDVAQQILFSPFSATRRLNANHYYNNEDDYALTGSVKNNNKLSKRILSKTSDFAQEHHPRKLLTGLLGYGICSISKIISDKSANIMKEICDCINKNVKMSYASKCSVYISLFAVLGCTADPPDCRSVGLKPNPMYIPDISALDLHMIDLLSKAGYILDRISDDVITSEGITYYILWKAVQMMYELHEALFCSKQSDVTSGEIKFFLPGWITEAYIHAAPSKDKNDSHLMTILLRREDTLLILTRGTKTRFEWKMNFAIRQVMSSSLKYSNNSSEIITWPGNIHYGYSLIFESIFPNIITYLRNYKNWSSGSQTSSESSVVKPEDFFKTNDKSDFVFHPIKRIIVSGHSLGSAVSVLLSYQLSLLFPGKVDMVGFGSPRVGDFSFQESFRRNVNARILQFSLDPVTSMPCDNILACDFETSFIPTPKLSQDDKQFNYVNDAAIVMITPSMMPTNNWSSLGSNLQAYAMHTCSYSCYLTYKFSPSDTHNQCRPPQRNEEAPYSGEVCPLWLLSYI